MKKTRKYKLTKKEEELTELAKYMDEYLQKAEAEGNEKIKNMSESELEKFNKEVMSFGFLWQS